MKKTLKKIFKWISTVALVLFVAAAWSVVYHEVRAAKLEIAFVNFQQAFAERVELNASHKKELAGILIRTMRGTTPAEDTRIKRRLSRIAEENEAADEKLIEAKKKFCDLAGKDEELCQEPAPPQTQGQLI